MKRSEALEKIRQILELNMVDNGMGELEEAILHTLETAGMLPPFHDSGYDYVNFRWEPENETT
jgi:hypothetical protein